MSKSRIFPVASPRAARYEKYRQSAVE